MPLEYTFNNTSLILSVAEPSSTALETTVVLGFPFSSFILQSSFSLPCSSPTGFPSLPETGQASAHLKTSAQSATSHFLCLPLYRNFTGLIPKCPSALSLKTSPPQGGLSNSPHHLRLPMSYAFKVPCTFSLQNLFVINVIRQFVWLFV